MNGRSAEEAYRLIQKRKRELAELTESAMRLDIIQAAANADKKQQDRLLRELEKRLREPGRIMVLSEGMSIHPRDDRGRPDASRDLEKLQATVRRLATDNIELRGKLLDAGGLIQMYARRLQEQKEADRPGVLRRAAWEFWLWLFPALEDEPVEQCQHADAVPVESAGVVVAGLCPACGEQLPAEHFRAGRPPDLVICAALVGRLYPLGGDEYEHAVGASSGTHGREHGAARPGGRHP